jgi:autotransporter-associated beta strand protein
VTFAPGNLTISSGVSQVGVQAGSLTAGNGRLAQLTAAAGSTTIAAGATLNFQDQLSGGGINALFGAGTVNTGTLSTTSLAVNSGNFSGNIAGSGGLVKATSGTLILSGQTAFIGGTTVNAGKLIVDGSLSFGFGDATVNSGGTIGGSGMMGTITLSGGTVAPGDQAGTLTAQNLFWQDGGIEADLGPTPAVSDLLAIGGLQGFGTTYPFTFVNQGWSVGSTYTLITFDLNNIPLNDFYFTNGGGFAGDFSLTSSALQFTLTAVPEPSTWALAACAGVVACLLRRRRRREL